AQRALLTELESRVALLERGLSVIVTEARYGRLAVRRRRRLIQIQEALATGGTTLVFNGEGLRGRHNVKRGEKGGGSYKGPDGCVEFHGGLHDNLLFLANPSSTICAAWRQTRYSTFRPTFLPVRTISFRPRRHQRHRSPARRAVLWRLPSQGGSLRVAEKRGI